ncbi:hypothetical protein [Thiofilum flexile]|uniref:hypothetical protein n=1 Tax=Thiofilum flexile TaxID=125627 RepID=UPI0013A56A8D|nr:hypothetical protein [Thiofilum flexile]
MEKAINQYGVNTYFKSSDLQDVSFRSTSRFYYWLTLLVEVGALEPHVHPNNKGAYLFSVTEKGKQCYECYLNSHSTYYANHILESDEDEVGSCILFINPIGTEAT